MKISRYIFSIIIILALIAGCETYSPKNDPVSDITIIPEPVSTTKKQGNFTLNSNTKLKAPEKISSLANLIKKEIFTASGLSLEGNGTSKIQLVIDPTISDSDEGYNLSVMKNLIVIVAPSERGLFYGYQSLKQLMPPQIYGKDTAKDVIKIPCVEIIDKPRFEWRGMHLDVGRHFFSVKDIKTYIDMLALHKINTFHWHLTEDQGWRIEIKKYPKLTQVGSIRPETVKGHLNKNRPLQYDKTPYGGYYTQKEAKEIVAYAAERYINVVPEIEMPGHAQAAVAAYPQFGNTGKNLTTMTKWGISDNIYNVEDQTITFLKDILDEIMEIFPSEFIHIGGDECPKAQWITSKSAQRKIKEKGLSGEHQLQSWFIEQFDTYLDSKGRRLIGWDEILEGGLAPGAAVMSWRGDTGGLAAAKQHHDVVMTPSHSTYFDYYQSDPKSEPIAIGGFLPISRVYSWNPLPSLLPKKDHKYIIGGQAQLWTEYMKDMDHVLVMAFPRGCALCEVLWSPKSKKSFGRFQYKMVAHELRLAWTGNSFNFSNKNIISKEFTIKKNANTINLSVEAAPSGAYQIYVTGNKGTPIETKSASIIIDGKEIDTSIHKGYSGSYNQGTIYTLNTGKIQTTESVKIIIGANVIKGESAEGKVIIKRL